MRGAKVIAKRQAAYRLFDSGKTVVEVYQIIAVSRRTGYIYFHDWQELRAAERKKPKERPHCWASGAILCKCNGSFWHQP